MQRVALIDPLGDVGIGTYTFELAEALEARGIRVDLYTHANPSTAAWPRQHRLYPVLGSALVRQRPEVSRALRGTSRTAVGGPAGGGETPRVAPARLPRFLKRSVVRDTYLTLELVAWLRLRKYDLVWTQWPVMGRGAPSFWLASRLCGLRVVHTAHNVFPHERSVGDYAQGRTVYRNSRLIITHSAMATRTLCATYPAVEPKVVTSRLGLYTSYPRRPGAREAIRRELAVPPASDLVLVFGGVRPYKNLDVLLRAMSVGGRRDFTLAVAGHEFGYSNLDGTDPLGLTRRRVTELGLGDCVRLLPGQASRERTSDLFEAADIVALPYAESYGSGVLSLAMSFGKCIVATRTGGMDEYLAAYDSGMIVEPDISAEGILAALHAGCDRATARRNGAARPHDLEWPQIVEKLLPDLERVSGR